MGEGSEDNKPHRIFASWRLGIRVDMDESGNVHYVSKYGTVNVTPRPHRAEYGDTRHSKDGMEDTLDPNTPQKPDSTRKARLDALLDQALDGSFPASDPVAISVKSPARIPRPSPKREGE